MYNNRDELYVAVIKNENNKIYKLENIMYWVIHKLTSFLTQKRERKEVHMWLNEWTNRRREGKEKEHK